MEFDLELQQKLLKITKEDNDNKAVAIALARAENAAKKEGRTLTDKETEAISKLAKAKYDVAEATEAIAKANREAEKAAAEALQRQKDYANVIGNAFEEAVLSGRKLSEVLHALAQDVLRIILRTTVTKNLENAIVEMFDKSKDAAKEGKKDLATTLKAEVTVEDLGLLTGDTKSKDPTKAAVASLTGNAQNVFVVNWPMEGLGGITPTTDQMPVTEDPAMFLQTLFESFKTTATEAFTAINDIITNIFTSLKTMGDNLLQDLTIISQKIDAMFDQAGLSEVSVERSQEITEVKKVWVENADEIATKTEAAAEAVGVPGVLKPSTQEEETQIDGFFQMFAGKVGSMFQNIGGVFTNIFGIVRNMGSNLVETFAQIASQIIKFFFFHDGGEVGRGGTKSVAPITVFKNAPRFHKGKDIPLANDEVPAILQTGERVLSRKQNEAFEKTEVFKEIIKLHSGGPVTKAAPIIVPQSFVRESIKYHDGGPVTKSAPIIVPQSFVRESIKYHDGGMVSLHKPTTIYNAPEYHKGGIVGPVTRSTTFYDVTRYHNGGVVAAPRPMTEEAPDKRGAKGDVAISFGDINVTVEDKGGSPGGGPRDAKGQDELGKRIGKAIERQLEVKVKDIFRKEMKPNGMLNPM
jgi:hypothetical protein